MRETDIIIGQGNIPSRSEATPTLALRNEATLDRSCVEASKTAAKAQTRTQPCEVS